jgi:hypothetical protein
MAHTGEVRALWIVVVVLFGCSSSEDRNGTLADAADGPLTFTLSTWWADPFGAPTVEPKPTVYIDGTQATELVVEYATNAEAVAAQHVIELRHGDVTVFSVTSSSTNRTCLTEQIIPRPPATHLSESWCAFSHGEVRFGSDQVQGPSFACVGDGFCLPACTPGSCASGERCTSIYASTDPIATHLGCVPAGTRSRDETCSLVTDAGGTHDDCSLGLLCVEGTCKRTCSPALTPPSGCTTCSYVLGHAPELGICN